MQNGISFQALQPHRLWHPVIFISGGLRPDQVGKIKTILSLLNASEIPEELDLPTFRFHALSGDRKDFFSITVRANWRITFSFEKGKAFRVDLKDYH
jgi:proteic killer suppression protein